VGPLYFESQPDGSVHVIDLSIGRIELVVHRDDSVAGTATAVDRLNRMKVIEKPLPQYVRECARKYSGWEM
jgi:hypothetical protein